MDLHPAKGVYPVPQLLESGLLAALSPPAVTVHMVLWDYARVYAECRPSMATIGAKTGLSKNTMTRVVRELQRAGLVKVFGRGKKAIFELNWENLPEVPQPKPAKRRQAPYRQSSEDDSFSLFLAADFHRVASRAELAVDDRLHLRGIPHWPSVLYSKFVPDRVLPPDCKWICDFVLHPKLIVEVLGTSAPKYREGVKRKTKAVARAEREIILIDESDLGYLDGKITADLRDRVLELWDRVPVENLEWWASQLAQVQQDPCSHWLRRFAREKQERLAEEEKEYLAQVEADAEREYKASWRPEDDPEGWRPRQEDVPDDDIGDFIDEVMSNRW